MVVFRWRAPVSIVFALIVFASPGGRAGAESLTEALAEAYRGNPSLNSQRASLRATDEAVPQALSGYRPKISITAEGGQQSLSSTVKLTTKPGSPNSYLTSSGYNSPFMVGLTLSQTLFNGFQTANRTREAESQVLAARATLAVTGQSVLLKAVSAYMDVLRDNAVLQLQSENVEVLQWQLRQTRDRFRVGEVTETDVAQAQSRLAAARSQLLRAEATYSSSVATYRQVIGAPPRHLEAAFPVDGLFPGSRAHAILLGESNSPAIAEAEYNVDVEQSRVKVAEGALLPNLSLQAHAQKSFLALGALSVMEQTNASVTGRLNVPVYQGGAEYSAIRQAKEKLGQFRLDLEAARDSVRQSVVQAWGELDAAKYKIDQIKVEVRAAEIAVNGVRDEALVGQRTTLDILNAEQELVNARTNLVRAERDRVVYSYTVLAAVGRLNPGVLKLPVEIYQPKAHYNQVRDAWVGVRNPDGR